MHFNVNTGVTMATYRQKHSLIRTWSCIAFVIAASTAEECDRSKCPGPIKYYEELGCTPIYKTAGSCCPMRYQCDHLEGRSLEKCYYRDHVYEIGENLREEDAGPCDINCVCHKGFQGIAEFTCAVVDCFNRPDPGCYLKQSHEFCCDGPQVCPEKDTDVAKCEVDGKIYFDGQHFNPKSDPEKQCYCKEGYKGDNVEPFCKPPNPNTCGTALRHTSAIVGKCAPVYYSQQNPATSCNLFSRCQNSNDTIIHNEEAAKAVPGDDGSDPASTCQFGNFTMKIGDQLNQSTDYSSVCVRCICQIPPLPTCKRLPDDECDVSVHPPFSR